MVIWEQRFVGNLLVENTQGTVLKKAEVVTIFAETIFVTDLRLNLRNERVRTSGLHPAKSSSWLL